MPTFPIYHGEMPQCLNPLKPHHWWLLLCWIYFRPSALKYYLYQADPEFYRTGKGLRIFRTLLIPAYRNLYLMAMIATLVLPFLFCLLEEPYESVSAVIVVFSFAFGVLLSMVVGTTNGVACGAVFGVTFVVAFIVMIVLFTRLTWLAVLAIVIALGVAFGVVGVVSVGVVFAISVGVMIVGTFGMVSVILSNIEVTMVANMAVVIVVVVIAVFGIGSLRLIFYLFEYILALCSIFPKVRHPLAWDELLVLPLPRTGQYMIEAFSRSRNSGLKCLRDVARNPLQRWATQKTLYRYVHTIRDPLNFLYAVLTQPDSMSYVVEPIDLREWELNCPVRNLFFGELADRFVKVGSYPGDRIVWWLTLPLRKRRSSPLTNFAEMIYNLLDEDRIEATPPDTLFSAESYRPLSTYPGGQEIVRTFDALAQCLAYQQLAELVEAAALTALHFDDPIRPTVITALQQLGEVGTEIRVYQDSSSRANKMAAVTRAIDALKDLDEYVQNEVMAPEQYLLRRIIRQWQALIIEAGGELGRAQVDGPVANPYVAGNPVTGELFVGREDILQRLEELWRGTGQKPSVVLYGHRRMGKSSILHNLGARFGRETLVVDFNMQRVGMVASTGELLFNLALAVYDALPTPDPSQEGNEPTPDPSQEGNEPTPVPSQEGNEPTPGPSQEGNWSFSEPEEKNFLEHNPYTAFDRFLKQVQRVRGDRRLIITVDEFELIEKYIKQGILEARLLDFWRGLIQTYPWFVMAFAGLHTLQEMTQDYWNPLFGSVTGIPISFLNEGAARHLITQPNADFDLDYDPDAIEAIIRLTHGQPYLIQLICHSLVSRFNRQMFEEDQSGKSKTERRFHLTDVEAVVTAPELFRDGDAYFSGVWKQASDGEAAEQHNLLRILASSGNGMSCEELIAQSGLSQAAAQQALNVLKRHDVIAEREGSWQFTVELMRRWVARNGVSRYISEKM